MNRGFLIFICFHQLCLVLSLLNITDVEVSFSNEYLGPDSYVELRKDYPNTFNVCFDVLKPYPAITTVNFDCYGKDDNGQYTLDIGMKYYSMKASAALEGVRKFKVSLQKKNNLKLHFIESRKYTIENLSIPQNMTLPDEMKPGQYQCTLVYFPTRNTSINSDAIATYVGKFLVE